ncbi:hypothetical protein ACOME3_004201 [Neoechinorhynchus agilis]
MLSSQVSDFMEPREESPTFEGFMSAADIIKFPLSHGFEPNEILNATIQRTTGTCLIPGSIFPFLVSINRSNIEYLICDRPRFVAFVYEDMSSVSIMRYGGLAEVLGKAYRSVGGLVQYILVVARIKCLFENAEPENWVPANLYSQARNGIHSFDANIRIIDHRVSFSSLIAETCQKAGYGDLYWEEVQRGAIRKSYEIYSSMTGMPIHIAARLDPLPLAKISLERTYTLFPILKKLDPPHDDPNEILFFVLRNVPLNSREAFMILHNKNTVYNKLVVLNEFLSNAQQLSEEEGATDVAIIKCHRCGGRIETADVIIRLKYNPNDDNANRPVYMHQNPLHAMLDDGLMLKFVNPQGVTFECLICDCINDVQTEQQMYDSFSWFPGYSWSVIWCESCLAHLGWGFRIRQQYKEQAVAFDDPLEFVAFDRRRITITEEDDRVSQFWEEGRLNVTFVNRRTAT